MNFIYENSAIKKCCSKCKHNLCACGLKPINCKNTPPCKFVVCGCNSNSCHIVLILKLSQLIQYLRNTFAHANQSDYENLEEEKGHLKDFPNIKKFEKLFKLFDSSTSTLLELISNEYPEILPENKLKKIQKEMKSVKLNEAHFISPDVLDIMNQFNDKVLEQSEKILKECLQSSKGLLIFISLLFDEDFILYFLFKLSN